MNKTIIILTAILFIACGSNNNNNKHAIEVDNDSNLTVEQNSTVLNSNTKVITIYVHGYQEKGYQEDHAYGQKWYNTFRTNLIKYTGLPTMGTYEWNDNFNNMLTSVDYYGKTAPDYYSQQDIDDIEKVTQEYGGGIPRYATIVAKFAKDILAHSKAEKINIISVSMGSLVTRWLIEKDVEHLASEKKIEKWITVEGVVRGNYALSVASDTVINLFLTQSPETEQMSYEWIEKHLTKEREKLGSPYYQDILVGQISLSDGSRKNSLLKYVLPFYGGFQPNDGFQLLRDTYFKTIGKTVQAPSHVILHGDHVDIKSNEAAFVNISNFLDAKKRVRITLQDTTITDIHEEISSSNEGSEIVFETEVHSSLSKSVWDLEHPIDARLYYSGALKIYNYSENGQTYNLQQTVFDGFVLNDEKELLVDIQGYEIDRSTTYDISETNKVSKKESLGQGSETIPLKNGSYKIEGADWTGLLKVEILEM